MTITKGFWEAAEIEFEGSSVYTIDAVTHEGNTLPVRNRVSYFYKPDDAQLCAKAPRMYDLLTQAKEFLETTAPDTAFPLISCISDCLSNETPF